MEANENADAANVGASNYLNPLPVDCSAAIAVLQEHVGAELPSTSDAGITGLNDPIIEVYYPGLGPTARACFAVCGAMSLKGRTRPLSVILEGPSGSGKTAVIQMFMPKAQPDLNEYIYRSDKFTPKAFVSHAANVKKADLDKIDMLPRLRDKILLTKELAPIFRGRDEELADNIAMLISVLDGDGFIGDSGMRGRRGYDEPIIFNWIGATTPLPERIHRMMSQLGTRLLFWEVPAIELTDSELLEYAKNGRADWAASESNGAVNWFLREFFASYPVGSVDPETIIFPELLLARLSRLAGFLVIGRAEVYREYDVPVSTAPPEGAYKVVNYFKDLALGHALISGRSEVNEIDLQLVEHVAISSVPGHIRPVVRQLRTADVTSGDCESLCRVSRPTARKRLRELEVLGIVNRIAGCPETNLPDTVGLADRFEWLRQP